MPPGTFCGSITDFGFTTNPTSSRAVETDNPGPQFETSRRLQAETGGCLMRANYLFTSESVSEGHPDKVCDRISDAIVDLFLGAQPEARVACETLATTNRVVIAGEVRGPSSITFDAIENVARHAIREI